MQHQATTCNALTPSETDAAWGRPASRAGTDAGPLALRYLLFAAVMGLLSAVAAFALRAELATPGLDLLSARSFGAMLSLHGILAFHLVLWPVLSVAVGQVWLARARPGGQLAFPRLAHASWFLVAAAGLVVLIGFLAGGTEAGWRLDAGFGGRFDQPGLGFVALGVLFVALSMVGTGLNAVVTANLSRREGGASRSGVVVTAGLVAGALTLLASAVLAILMALVLADRYLGWSVFAPDLGADPRYFARLFDLFLAPAQAGLLVFATGWVLQSVAARSGGMSVRRALPALLPIAIGGLLAWGGLQPMAAGLGLVGVLTGVVLALQNLRRGVRPVDATLVYGLGFLVLAVQAMGGALIEAMPSGGMPLASTTFAAARAHLLWIGLFGMALPAGLHEVWPALTGRSASDPAGRVAASLVFAGAQLAFAPMLLLGLRGLSFRANAYPPEFVVLQVLSTAGATILLAGLLLAVAALARFRASTLLRAAPALALAACVSVSGCGRAAPADARELRVTVSGMHCEGCAEGIAQKLRRQKGVLALDVHFSNTVQVIRYDAARVDPERLIAAISNAGFSVTGP